MTELIGILGGTGHLGHALARRWAKSGLRVMIGSRDAAKAQAAAGALADELGTEIESGANLKVAESAATVVVTVPFESQASILEEIGPVVTGKLVVDTTVPLVPPRVARVQLPPEGSAAMRARAILGPDVALVTAFHSVAAHKLATDEKIACDVLVFGDDKVARARTIRLVEAAGMRGLHAGSLANSVAAEALTSVLIFLNKNYSVDGAGIVVTGNLITPAD